MHRQPTVKLSAWRYNRGAINKKQYVDILAGLGLTNFQIIRELKWAKTTKTNEERRKRKEVSNG